MFILSMSVLFSCTTVDLRRKVTPPLGSFVKVYHSIKISECTDKYKNKCPVGEYHSMGSGMLVNVIEGEKIVITAGHVCESEIDTEKVAVSSQTVSVLDFRGIEHNARIIKTSQDDGKGSVDMCALYVPTLTGKSVGFSQFKPKPGQELYYVGAPAGIYHPPAAPILTGIYSGHIDASNSLISIPATGGSSGSVVMDLNNKMVGVLWAAHSFKNISIMTSWDSSAIFLYEVSKLYNNKKSNLILPPLKK
jgi:hypothetical protein